MSEDPNYGSPNYETQERSGGSVLRNAPDERAWSVLSHLSVFVNLVTGFLGPVASLVIWLVYREKSREVSFHALQSMWYQIAWIIILAAGWVITGLLMLILIGFLLAPFMALLTLVPFVHSAYAAYQVGKGNEFRYPVIADMIDNR